MTYYSLESPLDNPYISSILTCLNQNSWYFPKTTPKTTPPLVVNYWHLIHLNAYLFYIFSIPYIYLLPSCQSNLLNIFLILALFLHLEFRCSLFLSYNNLLAVLFVINHFTILSTPLSENSKGYQTIVKWKCVISLKLLVVSPDICALLTELQFSITVFC